MKFAGAVQEEIEVLISKWSRAGALAVNTQYDLSCLSEDIIGRIALGVHFGRQQVCEEDNHEARDRDIMMKEVMLRSVGPLLATLNRTHSKDVKRIQSESKQKMEYLVAQAMGGEDENMVTVMKRIQREGKIPFSDADVRCEISTIRGAGHETSSNTLSWALYLLAQSKHKAFLHKLQQEVDQVLGTQHTCSFDQVPLLSYTRWVIYETLRLFPTVPSFPVMNGGLFVVSIIMLNYLSAPGRCGL
jgi:cytochrome P450/NADPH-cytochrome P450 reductase